MAGNQVTVTARIIANTEGFEASLTRAASKLKSFGAQATRAGRDLTSSISLPLALVTTAALRTATSFELAQKKIQGLNPKNNIDRLTKSARQLGATTIFTAEEVSQLQLSLAKLGKSEATIRAIQGTILKFAQAMDKDLATSGEFLVKTMNRYADSLKHVGDEQAQANYVANVFASAAASTALDAEKLAAALNYVGSEAAVYGISLEETTALLGLLADRGFDASRGGTALRRILAQLGKDGYSASEAIEQLLSPTSGFREELEQFGLRGAGPAAALGGLKDEFEALKEKISSSSGFLNEFALILDSSLSASFKRVKSAAQEVSIAFTEDFKKAIVIATTNIARFLRKIAELPKPIKAIIVGLSTFLAIAGPLLLILGSLATALAVLTFWAGSLSAILTGGLSIVLAAAAGAMFLFTENTDTASMTMEELRKKVYESNAEMRDMARHELVSKKELEKIASLQVEIDRLTKLQQRLVKGNVGSSYNKRIKATADEIARLKDEQKKVNDEFKKFLDLQKQIIKDQEEAIANGTFMGPVVPDFLSDGKGGIRDTSAVTTVNDLLNQRVSILKSIDEATKEALKNKYKGFFDPNLLKSLNEELKGIESLLALVGISFKETGDEIEDLRDKIIDGTKPMKRLASDGSKVDAVFKSLSDTEVAKKVDTVFASVSDIAPELKTGFNLAQEAIGKMVDELNKDALLNSMLELESIAKSIGSVFEQAFQDALDGTESLAKSIKTNLTEAIRSLIAKLAGLAVAWGIVALLATIATGGGNLSSAASAIKQQGFVNFALQDFGLGSFQRSASEGGGLRVQGVLSGSDVVLTSRRGATALDRIYG